MMWIICRDQREADRMKRQNNSNDVVRFIAPFASQLCGMSGPAPSIVILKEGIRKNLQIGNEGSLIAILEARMKIHPGGGHVIDLN